MTREIIRSRIAPSEFASLWHALAAAFPGHSWWGLAGFATLGPEAQAWLDELRGAPGGRAVAAPADIGQRADAFGQILEGTLVALAGPAAVRAFLDGVPEQTLVERGLAEVVATVHDGDTLHVVVASAEKGPELERRLAEAFGGGAATDIVELDVVRLREDLPEKGLRRGDVGAVVNVFDEPSRAYQVEFVNDDGSTRALCVLPGERLERLPG